MNGQVLRQFSGRTSTSGAKLHGPGDTGQQEARDRSSLHAMDSKPSHEERHVPFLDLPNAHRCALATADNYSQPPTVRAPMEGVENPAPCCRAIPLLTL